MKKFLLWSLGLLLTLGGMLPNAQAQDSTTRNNDEAVQAERVKGRVLKTYREDDPATALQAEAAAANQTRKQRPLWVESAVQRSLDFLNRATAPKADQADNVATQTRRDARKDFALVSAEQDDLGLTHVRFNQFRNGVRVFGRQVVTHLNARNMAAVSGHELEASEVETTPAINNADALTTAKAVLQFNGTFKQAPQAELVILPNSLFKDDEDKGATLVYHVELQIEDGTDATAHHQYFISAQDSRIVWHFNSLTHGTGFSLYSGVQTINTRLTYVFPFFQYLLIDDPRGGAEVRNNTGGVFTKNSSNVWGNGTNANPESAAVDVLFGMGKTWDYFLFRHNRLGINGLGYKMVSRVHFGDNLNNAFWNGTDLTFGDGDGVEFSPLVSLDVVGHEITHGLVEKTAGLIYVAESGALDESFADIFGTLVEFYSNINPDYLIGEDCFTPGTLGDAIRSMANPPLFGQPDHYTNLQYPAPCTPSDANDQCGVHTNSGIQNNAFYLLAQGGTNGTSGLSVTGIGRTKAANIFFRALTVYLTQSDDFADARRWTLQAARDLYGLGSAEYNSTARAWLAVGVS